MSWNITELSRDRIKESGNEENDWKLYIKAEVTLGSGAACLESSTWETEADSLREPTWYTEQVSEQTPKAKQRDLAFFSKAEVMHYSDGEAQNTTKSKNFSRFLMYNTGKFP